MEDVELDNPVEVEGFDDAVEFEELDVTVDRDNVDIILEELELDNKLADDDDVMLEDVLDVDVIELWEVPEELEGGVEGALVDEVELATVAVEDCADTNWLRATKVTAAEKTKSINEKKVAPCFRPTLENCDTL